eukprot:970544-Pelagomonas_calceolata.AAC.2
MSSEVQSAPGQTHGGYAQQSCSVNDHDSCSCQPVAQMFLAMCFSPIPGNEFPEQYNSWTAPEKLKINFRIGPLETRSML